MKVTITWEPNDVVEGTILRADNNHIYRIIRFGEQYALMHATEWTISQSAGWRGDKEMAKLLNEIDAKPIDEAGNAKRF